MRIWDVYGTRYPYGFLPTYESRTKQFLNAEYQRLIKLARDLGLEMVALRRDDEFEFGFTDPDDKTRFIGVAFTLIHAVGRHFYIHASSGKDPRYVELWAKAVKDLATYYGAYYDTEILGQVVIVNLDSVEDYANFLLVLEDGTINKMAQARYDRLFGPGVDDPA